MSSDACGRCIFIEEDIACSKISGVPKGVAFKCGHNEIMEGVLNGSMKFTGTLNLIRWSPCKFVLSEWSGLLDTFCKELTNA